MEKVSLGGGVFTGAASFLLPGVGGLAVAQPWSLLWYLAWASILVGLGLLNWGVRISDRHWWQMLPRFRNPFARRGSLYCGRIIVSDSELDQKHFFDVSVTAFNGTSYRFQTVTIEGIVHIDFSLNGTGRGGFNVRAPVLYFETEKPHEPDKELIIGTRLFLEPSEAAEYRKREAAGETPQIMFSNLKIGLETKRGKQMRLPLWDGVSLQGGQVRGRIVCATGHASATAESAMGAN